MFPVLIYKLNTLFPNWRSFRAALFPVLICKSNTLFPDWSFSAVLFRVLIWQWSTSFSNWPFRTVSFRVFFLLELLAVRAFLGFREPNAICEALLGGGAHVPRLNFTATYVAISEHSRVACRNFINKCFTSFAPLTIHIRWNDANGTYGLYL